MRSFFTPVRLLVLAFILLLAGVVLPFLMVMKVLESTFFLNFLAYVLSLIGMMLGVAGTALIAISRRKK
jgi:hypothetical protein